MQPGGYIIQYIGAVIRWVLRNISQKKDTTFDTVLHGSIRSNQWKETTGNETVNFIYGMATLFLVSLLLNWFFKAK